MSGRGLDKFIEQKAIRIGGAEGRGPSTAATDAALAAMRRYLTTMDGAS